MCANDLNNFPFGTARFLRPTGDFHQYLHPIACPIKILFRYERATSIYLVDRVIPMLPQKLSNGLCSLNAGEDRLALTCMMEIDCKGVVVAHEIFESVIHVDYRMTYKNVTKILVEQDEILCTQYKRILPMLLHLPHPLPQVPHAHDTKKEPPSRNNVLLPFHWRRA
mgnify:CR=1 FL=1